VCRKIIYKRDAQGIVQCTAGLIFTTTTCNNTGVVIPLMPTWLYIILYNILLCEDMTFPVILFIKMYNVYTILLYVYVHHDVHL